MYIMCSSVQIVQESWEGDKLILIEEAICEALLKGQIFSSFLQRPVIGLNEDMGREVHFRKWE